MGADAERIHRAGAEVIAIAVDSQQRQIAMFERWPLPHTLFVSDPDGERYLRPLGLFDPDERNGLGLPGLLVIEPDGTEAFRHVGRDFADRTADAEMFAALEGLALEPITAPPGGPISKTASDSTATATATGAFLPEAYTPYFKGNQFAALAIARRLADDDPGRAVARQHRQMAQGSVEAWDRIRPGT